MAPPGDLEASFRLRVRPCRGEPVPASEEGEWDSLRWVRVGEKSVSVESGRESAERALGVGHRVRRSWLDGLFMIFFWGAFCGDGVGPLASERARFEALAVVFAVGVEAGGV